MASPWNPLFLNYFLKSVVWAILKKKKQQNIISTTGWQRFVNSLHTVFVTATRSFRLIYALALYCSCLGEFFIWKSGKTHEYFQFSEMQIDFKLHYDWEKIHLFVNFRADAPAQCGFWRDSLRVKHQDIGTFCGFGKLRIGGPWREVWFLKVASFIQKNVQRLARFKHLYKHTISFARFQLCQAFLLGSVSTEEAQSHPERLLTLVFVS